MTQWQADREEDFNSMAMLSSAIIFATVIVLAVLIFK